MTEVGPGFAVASDKIRRFQFVVNWFLLVGEKLLRAAVYLKFKWSLELFFSPTSSSIGTTFVVLLVFS